MYAVGSFSTVMHGSATYTRSNVFSFSATAPYAVTSWAPDVVAASGSRADEDGSAAVNSIAFAGGNCADAYIGGNFTRVNGTACRTSPRSAPAQGTSSPGSRTAPITVSTCCWR